MPAIARMARSYDQLRCSGRKEKAPPKRGFHPENAVARQDDR